MLKKIMSKQKKILQSAPVLKSATKTAQELEYEKYGISPEEADLIVETTIIGTDGSINKVFECKSCQKRFPKRYQLTRHLKTHTGERKFVCEICNKAYKEHSTLWHHKKTHQEETGHECNICHKKFTRKNVLKEHMHQHSGEKPYKCEECGKCFRQKSSLYVHSKVHKSKDLLKCQFCDKTFSTVSGRINHTKLCQQVSPVMIYPCLMCPEVFVNESLLLNHNNNCHMNEEEKKRAQLEEKLEEQQQLKPKSVQSSLPLFVVPPNDSSAVGNPLGQNYVVVKKTNEGTAVISDLNGGQVGMFPVINVQQTAVQPTPTIQNQNIQVNVPVQNESISVNGEQISTILQNQNIVTVDELGNTILMQGVSDIEQLGSQNVVTIQGLVHENVSNASIGVEYVGQETTTVNSGVGDVEIEIVNEPMELPDIQSTSVTVTEASNSTYERDIHESIPKNEILHIRDQSEMETPSCIDEVPSVDIPTTQFLIINNPSSTETACVTSHMHVPDNLNSLEEQAVSMLNSVTDLKSGTVIMTEGDGLVQLTNEEIPQSKTDSIKILNTFTVSELNEEGIKTKPVETNELVAENEVLIGSDTNEKIDQDQNNFKPRDVASPEEGANEVHGRSNNTRLNTSNIDELDNQNQAQVTGVQPKETQIEMLEHLSKENALNAERGTPHLETANENPACVAPSVKKPADLDKEAEALMTLAGMSDGEIHIPWIQKAESWVSNLLHVFYQSPSSKARDIARHQLAKIEKQLVTPSVLKRGRATIKEMLQKARSQKSEDEEMIERLCEKLQLKNIDIRNTIARLQVETSESKASNLHTAKDSSNTQAVGVSTPSGVEPFVIVPIIKQRDGQMVMTVPQNPANVPVVWLPNQKQSGTKSRQSSQKKPIRLLPKDPNKNYNYRGKVEEKKPLSEASIRLRNLIASGDIQTPAIPKRRRIIIPEFKRPKEVPKKAVPKASKMSMKHKALLKQLQKKVTPSPSSLPKSTSILTSEQLAVLYPHLVKKPASANQNPTLQPVPTHMIGSEGNQSKEVVLKPGQSLLKPNVTAVASLTTDKHTLAVETSSSIPTASTVSIPPKDLEIEENTGKLIQAAQVLFSSENEQNCLEESNKTNDLNEEMTPVENITTCSDSDNESDGTNLPYGYSPARDELTSDRLNISIDVDIADLATDSDNSIFNLLNKDSSSQDVAISPEKFLNLNITKPVDSEDGKHLTVPLPEKFLNLAKQLDLEENKKAFLPIPEKFLNLSPIKADSAEERNKANTLAEKLIDIAASSVGKHKCDMIVPDLEESILNENETEIVIKAPSLPDTTAIRDNAEFNDISLRANTSISLGGKNGEPFSAFSFSHNKESSSPTISPVKDQENTNDSPLKGDVCLGYAKVPIQNWTSKIAPSEIQTDSQGSVVKDPYPALDFSSFLPGTLDLSNSASNGGFKDTNSVFKDALGGTEFSTGFKGVYNADDEDTRGSFTAVMENMKQLQ